MWSTPVAHPTDRPTRTWANQVRVFRVLGAVFDAVYVKDRELVAVQVRGPFRRLLGDVANHVRMVSGPGEVVGK